MHAVLVSVLVLVYLDNGVDFPHKPETSHKAHGPCTQLTTHNKTVTGVQISH